MGAEREILYPTLEEVLAIHNGLISIFGGRSGVLDLGLVESALFRPQTGHYSDLYQQAAALWESLSQSHPFVNGNKRTAFAVTDVFLRLNVSKIQCDPNRAFEEINRLYETGEFNLLELDKWLRTNST